MHLSYLNLNMLVNLVLFINLCVWACSANLLQSKPGQEEPPKEVYVDEKQSLYLWWKAYSSKVVACKLQGPTLAEDLVAGNERASFLGPSLESGYCGAVLPSVSRADEGNWSLTASDSNSTLTVTTSLKILLQFNATDSNLTVVEGQTFNVACGDDGASFCELTAPDKTRTVFIKNGGCKLMVSDAKSSKHAGTWTCRFAQPFHLFEYTAKVDVTIVPEEKDSTGVTEYDGWMVVYCKTVPSGSPVEYCRITTPSGLELVLKPGLGYGKYMYWGHSQNDCGVSIPKPLRPEDEGTWRCEAGQGINRLPVGGYLHLGQDTSQTAVEYQKEKIFWPHGISLNPVLMCHVNYSIDYCWFSSPNGTSFIVDDQHESSIFTGAHMGLGFSFGDCALRVPEVDLPYASGNWKCHIGLTKGSIKELTAKLNVFYAEGPLAAHKKEVGAPLGWPTTLGCFTTDQAPLKYCRLVRPDTASLLISELRNDSSYSYWGGGLEAGQCGVSIHSVSPEDLGKWTCAVKLLVYTGDVPEYQVSVQLILTPGRNIGLWVGVGVGVTLVLAFVGLVVFWRWRTRGRASDPASQEALLVVEETPITTVGELRRRVSRRQESALSDRF